MQPAPLGALSEADGLRPDLPTHTPLDWPDIPVERCSSCSIEFALCSCGSFRLSLEASSAASRAAPSVRSRGFAFRPAFVAVRFVFFMGRVGLRILEKWSPRRWISSHGPVIPSPVSEDRRYAKG
jgi:hypothetical protein